MKYTKEINEVLTVVSRMTVANEELYAAQKALNQFNRNSAFLDIFSAEERDLLRDISNKLDDMRNRTSKASIRLYIEKAL